MHKTFVREVIIAFGMILIRSACFPGYGQQDTIPPVTPVLEYISVDPGNGNTSLFWEPSPDSDVLGYIIYRMQNNVWVPIDSLFRADDTTYTDLTSRAAFFPESYVIAAFDTTRNRSPLTPPHQTVFLQSELDSCFAEINLGWNAYTGWDTLSRYRIFMKEGTGIYLPVDSVSGNRIKDTITDITANKTYCFYVAAVHPAGYISTSNGTCTQAGMLQPPAYILANGAMVSDNKDVALSFYPDTSGELNRYNLFRKNDPAAPWNLIAALVDSPGREIQYTDHLDTINTPLYYKLAALNPCGENITWSNTATAMLLNGINDGFINQLTWTPYLTYPGGVESYTVYRQNPDWSWNPVGTVNGTDTSFSDNIEMLQYQPGNNGKYCYYVEASGRNMDGIASLLISRSTIMCLTGKFTLFVPNAFTPDNDGRNDLFAPVITFAPVTYQMIIRNRWGIILFETTNYLKPWDGRDLSGKAVSEGTYTYFIRLTTPDNEILTRTGTVTVIYP
ncbi:MAG: gliding motility-associated C-terminal domain-containing protein [Chlorobi bacterium]|nr:gliding motility-associated C-terminal domain-containing protein [Chlorobiota bacterium]